MSGKSKETMEEIKVMDARNILIMLKRLLEIIITLVWLCTCGLLGAIPSIIVYENLRYQERDEYTVILLALWVFVTAILALLSMKVLYAMKNLVGIIFDKTTDAIIEPSSEYYEQAEQEINDGTFNKGLWARALTKAKGNEDRRKAEYIILRAKQLQKES